MEYPSNIIVKLLLFFVFAQLLGIYVGNVVIKDLSANPYVQSLVITTQPEDPLNAVYFFSYILAGAVFFIVLIRIIKSDLAFRLMEFLLVSSSSSVVFYAFLRPFYYFEDAVLFGVVCGLAFAVIKFLSVSVKNLATILATAGVGVIFGISFSVIPAILFLLLLAIYDYAAVFITKHMVEMADFLIKKELAFTITSRETIAVPGKPKEEKRIDLGSGDMVAPIMFEVSLLSFNPIATAFVFVGAVISLSLFLFLVWKKKMVLPALPPIVAGMLVFFFLGMFIHAY